MSQATSQQNISSILPYIQDLESLASDFSWRSLENSEERIAKALNGELSKTLHNLVNPKTLQDSGAFFTPDEIAHKLIDSIKSEIAHGKTVLDPACGGGNLLIEFAKHLPLGSSLNDTIKLWGDYIYGFDLHEEFIKATKARLVLLALQRGNFRDPLEIDHTKTFLNIKRGNSLVIDWPNVDFIVMNPPFNSCKPKKSISWSKGKVSQAALFIYKYIEINTKSRLISILPDILRSGTRYQKWRSVIKEKTNLNRDIEIFGRFDNKTNVDVFFLDISKTSSLQESAWEFKSKQEEYYHKVSDFFDVHVGPVVPHRHVEEGSSYKYVDVNNIPFWEEYNIEKHNISRKFKGTTYKTPLVIIKRNSKADEKYRAVATILTAPSKIAIAVENHLIVAIPKSGKLKECKKLLSVLKNESTSLWLNYEIRCRHLTVGSVLSIPWRENEQ